MRYRWFVVSICAAVAALAALLPPPRQETVAVLQEFGGIAEPDIDAQSALSRSSLTRLIRKYGLYPGQPEPVDIMRRAVHIARSGPMLIEVRFQYRDAERARMVTNEIAEDLIRVFAARELDRWRFVVQSCVDRLKLLAHDTPMPSHLDRELLREDYEKARQQLDRARLQLAAQKQGLRSRLELRDRARLRTKSLISTAPQNADGSEIRFLPSLLPDWLVPFDSGPLLRHSAADALLAFAKAHPQVAIRRDDRSIWLGTRDERLLSVFLDDLIGRKAMRFEKTVTFLQIQKEATASEWERVAALPPSDRQRADLAFARQRYIHARQQWRLAQFAVDLDRRQELPTLTLMP